jgi:hypothetical protein
MGTRVSMANTVENRIRTMRVLIILIGLLLVLSSVAPMLARALAAADAPKVAIKAENVQPREVEDVTRAAIEREYTNAWKQLSEALANNNAGALDANFTGTARKMFGERIAQQLKAGTSVKIVDRGHDAQIVFYSPEGSSIQLKDVADLEIQYLDGGKVVHSERVKQNYIALLTVGEERWKVRVLQEIQ